MSCRIATVVPAQKIVSVGNCFAAVINVPGFAVLVGVTPPLTDEEAEAYYLSGGRDAFFQASQDLYNAINVVIPQGLGT